MMNDFETKKQIIGNYQLITNEYVNKNCKIFEF